MVGETHQAAAALMGFSNLAFKGIPIHADFILHGLSASCHSVLLLVLFVIWVSRWRKDGERLQATRPTFYKESLFTCFSLGLFYLLFCIVGYFQYMDGWWPVVKIATEVDLAIRAVSWLIISLYLHFEVFEKRFPAVLRIWWVLFLLVSISSLVGDIAGYVEGEDFETTLWVLDIGSVIAGLILAYAGFFGMTCEDTNPDLQEPLLQSSADGSSRTPSGFSNASFYSILSFSWMNPVLSTGHEKRLDLKHVPELAPVDRANNVFSKLKEILEFQNRDNGGDASNSENGGDANGITSLKLAKALLFLVWKEVLLTGLFTLLNILTSYTGPVLLKYFVDYISGRRHFANERYFLASAFIGSKLLQCLAQSQQSFRLSQAQLRIRTSLVAMIYQKGFMLSSSSRQGRATGEIINIMSVDTVNVSGFVHDVHNLWTVPLELILSVSLLSYTVGYASVAALGATVFALAVGTPFFVNLVHFSTKMMECKDARMKATSEVLGSMRVLKLQAWDMKFLSKVMNLRDTEANWLKKLKFIHVIYAVVMTNTPTFIASVTFIVCVSKGIPLELGNVLAAIAIFGTLTQPIHSLIVVVGTIFECKVSLDRITSFLCLVGLQQDAVKKLPSGSSEVAIEVNNGTFSWDPSSEVSTLKDLNFRMLRGMKVAVCGGVGSGKSSFLSSILGEIPKVSGTVKLCGTVAYVAQSAWIQSGTIQDNILFGMTMDREKYESVLEACSLKEDIEKLPFADRTIIGEKGLNLSGGQKQRIQIARALYHDADIYIFDDPFSAVDAHTGSHLFKECLLRFLASKTVVYVTHQVEFLPPADLILVMKDGRITQAGKYDDILSSGVDFMELVGAHKDALATINSVELCAESSSNNSRDSEVREQGLHDGGKQKGTRNGKTDDTVTGRGQLVEEEERETGRVGLGVYWRYITLLYNGALVPPLLLTYCLSSSVDYARNYWTTWAVPASKDMEAPVSGLVFIYVYVALAFAITLSVFTRLSLVATVGYKTGTIMFNKMHMCLFRAPMAFFDSTPSGRILSRATSDQSDVDMQTADAFSWTVFVAIRILFSVAVITQVSWQVLIIFVPVISACIWYQQYYIVTARELTRLVGVCSAPNIQHFSESLLGSMTIRSFNQESRFIKTNFDLIDEYSRPRFCSAGANEWFGFRMDMLSFVTFSFFVTILISLPEGYISPAIAGLALNYGLSLNGLQTSLIWSLCTLENRMVSVERMLQYTIIPSEPPVTIEATKPDCNWPTKGVVVLDDLQVRYTPHTPLVLKGLTCSFPGGKKTGIVGRTGCGKTTLIQALFRIVDPTSGRILIDGIDISTLGLHDLRSKLSIIPQDPTMFEGTVRNNLDPLEVYTDEQIWKALDCCQLGDEIRKKPLKLDSQVTENGDNWSVGQRQLVCLGRVILKRSKVLVLDEATASMDTATDSLIHKTIRLHFSDSTVITIAHRITSIIDSDMVLLLDNGNIAENDTPSRLLENKSSLFSKLVSEYSMR